MVAKGKSKKIKYFVAILSVLILGLTLGQAYRNSAVSYYQVNPMDINHTVLASGRISYPQPYDIVAGVSGKISEICCREGELVQEGELLLQMDDFQDVQNMRVARSNLNLALSKEQNLVEQARPLQEEQVQQDKIRLDQAQKEMERLKTLQDAGAVASVELEKAVNAYQTALSQYKQGLLTRDSLAGGSSEAGVLAQIENYEAQYQLAQKEVEDKALKAPFTGLVSQVNFSAGQQVTAGTVLITLLQQQKWVVEAEVDQTEIALLRAGQPALVVLDAYPQEKLEAVLTYISPQVDIQKGTCLLRLEIETPKNFIKYGMAADVELLSESNKQVLALPKRFLDLSGKDAYVWTWENRKAGRTPVTYRSLGERWAVIEGIPAGTVVLSPGKNSRIFGIRPGQEVLPDAV